jgi:hypothetical protein
VIHDVSSSIPRVATVVAAVAALAGRATAHGGETTGPHDAPIAVAVGAGGVALVASAVYLDASRDLNRQYVDGAVFLGIAAALVGIALYWL